MAQTLPSNHLAQCERSFVGWCTRHAAGAPAGARIVTADTHNTITVAVRSALGEVVGNPDESILATDVDSRVALHLRGGMQIFVGTQPSLPSPHAPLSFSPQNHPQLETPLTPTQHGGGSTPARV
jgi:hypothetical protein